MSMNVKDASVCKEMLMFAMPEANSGVLSVSFEYPGIDNDCVQ